MAGVLDRRGFLKASAALATGAAGFSCVEVARAAQIEIPTVDKLSLRVLIDSAHDQFLKPSTVQGVVHQPPGNGRGSDYRKVLHNQWGLDARAYMDSQRSSCACPRSVRSCVGRWMDG